MHHHRQRNFFWLVITKKKAVVVRRLSSPFCSLGSTRFFIVDSASISDQTRLLFFLSTCPDAMPERKADFRYILRRKFQSVTTKRFFLFYFVIFSFSCDLSHAGSPMQQHRATPQSLPVAVSPSCSIPTTLAHMLSRVWLRVSALWAPTCLI